MLKDFACSALPIRECEGIPACSLPGFQLTVFLPLCSSSWRIWVSDVAVVERGSTGSESGSWTVVPPHCHSRCLWMPVVVVR